MKRIHISGNTLQKMGRGVLNKIKNYDWARTGRELLSSLPEVHVKDIVIGTIGLASGAAIGALSRQPEINKLKNTNKKVVKENERLLYAVESLNHDVDIIHKKIEALKAYQFGEKAKQEASLKGCIMYQYATKDYIEILINESESKGICHKDKLYTEIFLGILNGEELSKTEIKVIEDRIYRKYKEEIDNMIEYDCLQLLDRMEA